MKTLINVAMVGLVFIALMSRAQAQAVCDTAHDGTEVVANGDVLDAPEWNTEWANIKKCAAERLKKSGDTMLGDLLMDDPACILLTGFPCRVDGVDVSQLGTDFASHAGAATAHGSDGAVVGINTLNAAEADDLTTSTIFGGDVSGTYNGIQLSANSVGASEIADDSITSADIAADAVGSLELATTTVAAGNYTLATITVDADGRLTSALSGSETGDISSVGSCTSGDCFIDGMNQSLVFEGATTDLFEITLSSADPTADRSITLPDATGELSVLGQTIESSEITDLTITTDDIAADTIVAGDIAPNAVGSSELVATTVAAGNYTLATITVDADGRLTSALSGSETGDISSVGSCTSGDCFIDGMNQSLVFEGATTDLFEITLSSADPTADRFITLPDATGELSVLGQTIESSEITDSTITTDDIAADTIVAGDIAPNAVGSSEIAADAVGTLEISAGGVATDEILDNTITATDLAATMTFADADLLDLSAILHNDVTGQGIKLPQGTASPTNLSGAGEGHLYWETDADTLWIFNGVTWSSASNPFGASIDSSEITNDDVAGTDINESTLVLDGLIDDNDLAVGAVDGGLAGEIADGTITTDDLGTNSVGVDEIATDAVGTSEISAGGVTTDEILDNTVSAADLAATLTFADGDLIDLSAINASGTGEGLILPRGLDVSLATTAGQISWDTDQKILYVGDGTFAVAVSNPFGASIDSSEITDGTVSSANIAADTITASDIATGGVATDEILDGTILEADIFQDENNAASLDNRYLNETGDTVTGSLHFSPDGGVTRSARIDAFGRATFGSDVRLGIFRIHGIGQSGAPAEVYVTNAIAGQSTMLRLLGNFETTGLEGGFILNDVPTDLFRIGTHKPGSGDVNGISISRSSQNVSMGALIPEPGETGARLFVLGDHTGLHAVTNNGDPHPPIGRASAIFAEAFDQRDYGGDVVTINARKPGSSVYNLIRGLGGSSDLRVSDTKFRVDGTGTVRAVDTQIRALDYAEYFCGTVDDVQIAVGTTVVLEGEKLRLALEGENPIGVVRPKEGAAGIIGGSDWTGPSDKYLTDDYGAPIYDDVQFVKWTETIEDENHVIREEERFYRVDLLPPDVTVPDDAEHLKMRDRKLNPDYDPNAPFVPKEERLDCYVVGLLGQVPITKGQPVAGNWLKIRGISETVELWLIK